MSTFAEILNDVWDPGNHRLNINNTLMPVGAQQLEASSGNKANSVANATLPGAPGKTTYITGFEVTGSGATAGLPVPVTVSGKLGGTSTYVYTASAGALIGNTPLIVRFPSPIPASDVNTDIVVSCPALGLGNTNNSVVAHGFQA